MGFTVTQICSGFSGLYWLDFSFIYIHYGPDKSGQDSPLCFCFQPSLSVLSFLLSLLLHFLRWGTSTQFIRTPISCLPASTFLVLCKNKCSLSPTLQPIHPCPSHNTSENRPVPPWQAPPYFSISNMYVYECVFCLHICITLVKCLLQMPERLRFPGSGVLDGRLQAAM